MTTNTTFHNDPSPIRELHEIKEGEWFILVGQPWARCRMLGGEDTYYFWCMKYNSGGAREEKYRVSCDMLGVVIPTPKSIETTTTLSW